MTLNARIALADRLSRQYRAEYHALLSVKLRQPRWKKFSEIDWEEAAFQRARAEGEDILYRGEGMGDERERQNDDQ